MYNLPFTREELRELKYAASIHVSPYIIALSMKKSVAAVINKLAELGLRKKIGYNEHPF